MIDRRWASRILPFCLLLLVGCDNFDEEAASAEILERVCGDWAYACTDSTRVVVEDVRKTRHGRQVDFRLVDRRDETGILSAAYFEPQEDEWAFLLFEPPFSGQLRGQVDRLQADRRRFDDELMELKAAQKWFLSIYGRYARSFAELDSVSYKAPDIPLTMQVDRGGRGWRAEVSSAYVRCELDPARQQLPRCEARRAEGVGTDSGPLSTAFGRAE